VFYCLAQAAIWAGTVSIKLDQTSSLLQTRLRYSCRLCIVISTTYSKHTIDGDKMVFPFAIPP